MRSKASYLMTLLCIPTAAAVIANAPVAVADDSGSPPAPTDNTDSPAAPADNTDSLPVAPADDLATSPVCFPANDVRTAQQAADVQSACG